MSIVDVVGEVIGGRISPAAVWIEHESLFAQPRRRRYITACLAPFPDSSASEPSGLKIRRRAMNPGSSDSESSRMPSEKTPVWGAQIARIRAGVSENGSEAASTIT